MTITFRTNLDIAKETLGKTMFAVYKFKVRGLLGIIKRKLKDWRVKSEEKDVLVFVEEGDPDYIAEQKRKLEAFLMGDSDALLNDPEVMRLKTDRMMHKMTTVLRKAGKVTKQKAIKTAIGEDSVLAFFNRVGILVEWAVEGL